MSKFTMSYKEYLDHKYSAESIGEDADKEIERHIKEKTELCRENERLESELKLMAEFAQMRSPAFCGCKGYPRHKPIYFEDCKYHRIAELAQQLTRENSYE